MKTLPMLKILKLVTAGFIATLIMFSCEEKVTDSDGDGPETRVTINSGDNQTERTGAILPNPLVVKVGNVVGDPQPGIRVDFKTDDPGAYVSPSFDVSDSEGLASCTFLLGTEPGDQHVRAVIEEDSTLFTAVATTIGCDEEEPSRVCVWPLHRIFISTTSSSLLEGDGSVVIDYNPRTHEITKLFETPEIITDLTFSPRGELFLALSDRIVKVDPSTYAFTDFGSYPEAWEVEISPNYGGIVAGVSENGPFAVPCPPSPLVDLDPTGALQSIEWENLTTHPVTRDLYLITGSPTHFYRIWRIPWDGRSAPGPSVVHAEIQTGVAEPKGMCIDSTGTLYITFDGENPTSNYRRIVSVSSDGEVNDKLFDFYEHFGGDNDDSGRWGDITYLNGNLYLIDRFNNRLVVISSAGEWVEEVKSEAFSAQTTLEDEIYGIAASPTWICNGKK